MNWTGRLDGQEEFWQRKFLGSGHS